MKFGLRWILSFLLIWQGGVCLAQFSGSGDIRGTVTDNTGSLIPGATVNVLNVDTGVSRTYTTDSVGLFDTSSIVTGNYRITFSQAGFEKLVRGPITVQVGYTTVNAQLTIGSVSQQIVVNTDVPLLQTESHEQSITLESAALISLPEVGQDWENFTVMAPGATGTPSGGTAANPGQNVSVNGNLPYANFTLDGSSTTLVNSSNSTVVTLETVAEFQMSTSTFSAQSGIGGIQFNQITKGGTNKFHGAAYEYLQNDDFDAANYGFGNPVSVPYLRYDNFGGSVGGPILKNKMFFYFNYDKTWSNSGASTGFSTFPTAAIMSGDFTGYPTIYDPKTQVVTLTGTVTQPDGTVQTCPCVTRTSFAQEYGNGNKIPAALIDPVAKAAQALYPTQSNHPSSGMFVPGTLQANGVLANNYYSSLPTLTKLPKYFGRLDYDVSSTNRVTASVNQQDNPSNWTSPFAFPVSWEAVDIENNNAQVSDVWNISAQTINEARYGFTMQLNFFEDATQGKGYPKELGLQFAKADVLPNFNIGNYTGISQGTQAILKEFTYDPSDVVTLIRGKHIMHFGGEFLMYINNATQWGAVNSGSFYFDGGYTQAYVGNAATGVGYADFLLGQSSSWNASVVPEYGARYKTPQFFVQDDFKLKPNLTLNLGVRYTIQHGWSEVKGNMSSFDPTVMNPATNTLGAIWYGTTKANGRTSMEASIWDSVLPRFGFSWQPRPNMTIRGGYGLYDYNYTLGTKGIGMGGVEQFYGSAADQTNGITPAVVLSSNGANLPWVSGTTDPAALNGQTPNYSAYNAPDNKIHQWNLAVQRTIGTTMVGEVAYVGSHAFDLIFPVDINQVPASNLGPNDSPSGRPYPQYASIYTQSGTNNDISNYHAVQASISKRLTSGLSFNFNYTWSHFLDDMDSNANTNGNSGTASYQNGHDPASNYGSSNYDVRHAFKGFATYQLPVGVGRRYLNNNRILDGIIGGWNTSAILRTQTGTPYTPIINVNNSYSQAGNWYPNLIGNPNAHGHNINTGWFDPTAFASPMNATFGNSRRNSLHGPGLTKVDMSLGKTFSAWESSKLDIRIDANNVFNHPGFGDPNYGLTCPTQGAACSSSNVTNVTSLTVGGRTMQLGAHLSF